MRRTLVILSSIALAAGLIVAAPATAQAATTTALPDSHPAWATPSQKVAATASGTQVGFSVYLKMQDLAAATAAATAFADPHGSSYHQYLTPAQVRSKYAATDATVGAVRQWLSSAGFTVGDTAANNAYVQATGTAAQIQSAFAVHLNTYAVDGQQRRAADSDLQLPQSIASSILSINGLNQSLSTPLNLSLIHI